MKDEGEEPASDPLGETTYRLFSRWQAGDERALDDLCRRYEKALQSFFHLRLPRGSRSLLETADLVQETLLRTVQKLDGFDYSRPHAIGRYFFKAARNRLQTERKNAANGAGVSSLTSELEDCRPSPLEEIVGKEQLELYEEALASLREKDQNLIFHRSELGMKFEQIAVSLEMSSPDAARMATTRAITSLAKKMTQLAKDRGLRL